jgi:hypothetical protein
LRNQLRASRSGIQKTKKEKKNNTKSTKRKQKLETWCWKEKRKNWVRIKNRQPAP